MELIYLIKFFHFAFAAVWFGNSLTVPGRFRRSLQAGAGETKFTVAEGGRSTFLSLIFGILTFVTGMILIFKMGGFAMLKENHRMGIHMAMGIVMLMILLDVFMMLFWKKVAQAVDGGATGDALKGFRGKLAMFSGIQQLLWAVVLYIMVAKL